MNNARLITGQIRELVAAHHATAERDAQTEHGLAALVGHTALRCANPEIRVRYNTYPAWRGVMEPYPLDSEGYAQAFDPLYEENDLYETWRRYGVVVAKNVVPTAQCDAAVRMVHDTLNVLSNGNLVISRPETYAHMPVDSRGVPILTRGFFEVYHDDALAQLRQSPELYLHHVLLWGQASLWTTFDRLGVKLPNHHESAALPLHVDQNPNIHPSFKTTQGVLALEDCPAERGTLVVAPGSKQYFSRYGRMALNKGEYVELDHKDPIAERLATHAQPLPLRKGHLATWDSRTTHANSTNSSDKTRFIALLSAGPAREDDSTAMMAREEAFRTGLGSNVREALMHASRRPRYTDPDRLATVRAPERLTLLGKLLYGEMSYGSI